MTIADVKIQPKPRKKSPKKPYKKIILLALILVTTIAGGVFSWFRLKNEQQQVQALLSEACQANNLSDITTLEASKRNLEQANNILILSKIPLLGSQELLTNYNSCKDKIKTADNLFAQLKTLVAEFRVFTNDKPLTGFDIPKYSERLDKLEKQFSNFTNQSRIIQDERIVLHLQNALDKYKLGLQARLDCQKGDNCFPAYITKEPFLVHSSKLGSRLIQDYEMEVKYPFYQSFFSTKPGIKLNDAITTLENSAQTSITAAENHLY